MQPIDNFEANETFMSSEPTRWRETKIYQEIKKRVGDNQNEVKTLLDNAAVLDSIQSILNKGNTTPKDFTLHDADHSFRVAEKMWDIIPTQTQEALTDYELGFLLLSAYLHDIGMSPDYEKVEKHRKFLVGEDKSCLNENEIQEFQKWIDNNDRLKTIDIRTESIQTIEESNEILTYYIRHKHNDWSKDWIISNLSKEANPTEGTTNPLLLRAYPNWQTDLILLCQSHHWGIDRLLSEEFDFKPLTGSHISLRYLAMALRVADVMENDPERTPEVILRHRSISPKSIAYWLKDKHFTLTTKQDEPGKYYLYARAERAYLQKAIEETAKWIEDEFKLCEALNEEKPLNVNRAKVNTNYQWVIHSTLDKDIAPMPGAYEYIQGGFRPNTAKVLDLLGGNQLYGDPIWAYRELVQNAMDGVKEKLAYQIVNEDKDPKVFLHKLGEMTSIRITLEKRNEDYFLICSDEGVGMTKGIIEKFFLESGSSRRHEIKELERKCKEKEFLLGRTGQFGIGVLSYFMIADRIVVTTKREQLTGYENDQSVAWRFEINGAHDFGELKKTTANVKGTQIELKLKKSITDDIANWDKKFSDFLNLNILRTPCNVHYSSLDTSVNRTILSGWINTKELIIEKIKEQLKSDLDKSIQDILTESERMKEMKDQKWIEEILYKAPPTIDFLYDEGEIPNIGKYRIFVPYFKLHEGGALVYLKEEEDNGMKYVCSYMGDFWMPYFSEINFGLKGIVTTTSSDAIRNYSFLYNTSNTYIDVDIENIEENQISVSRHKLTLDKIETKILSHIEFRLSNLLNKNEALFNNKYNSICRDLIGKSVNSEQWLFPLDSAPEQDRNLFKPISFPIYYYHSDRLFTHFRGKKIQPLHVLRNYSEPRNSHHDFTARRKHEHLIWGNELMLKYTLGFSRSEEIHFEALITGFIRETDNDFLKLEQSKLHASLGLSIIETPPNFEKILFFAGKYSSTQHINLNNEILKRYNLNNPVSIKYRYNLPINELNTPGACLKFIRYLLNYYTDERWVALSEKIAQPLLHAFNMLELSEIIILKHTGLILRVTPTTWEYLENVHDYYPREIDENFILS